LGPRDARHAEKSNDRNEGNGKATVFHGTLLLLLAGWIEPLIREKAARTTLGDSIRDVKPV
jgi:hypothetical protein